MNDNEAAGGQDKPPEVQPPEGDNEVPDELYTIDKSHKKARSKRQRSLSNAYREFEGLSEAMQRDQLRETRSSRQQSKSRTGPGQSSCARSSSERVSGDGGVCSTLVTVCTSSVTMQQCFNVIEALLKDPEIAPMVNGTWQFGSSCLFLLDVYRKKAREFLQGKRSTTVDEMVANLNKVADLLLGGGAKNDNEKLRQIAFMFNKKFRAACKAEGIPYIPGSHSAVKETKKKGQKNTTPKSGGTIDDTSSGARDRSKGAKQGVDSNAAGARSEAKKQKRAGDSSASRERPAESFSDHGGGVGEAGTDASLLYLMSNNGQSRDANIAQIRDMSAAEKKDMLQTLRAGEQKSDKNAGGQTTSRAKLPRRTTRTPDARGGRSPMEPSVGQSNDMVRSRRNSCADLHQAGSGGNFETSNLSEHSPRAAYRRQRGGAGASTGANGGAGEGDGQGTPVGPSMAPQLGPSGRLGSANIPLFNTSSGNHAGDPSPRIPDLPFTPDMHPKLPHTPVAEMLLKQQKAMAASRNLPDLGDGHFVDKLFGQRFGRHLTLDGRPPVGGPDVGMLTSNARVPPLEDPAMPGMPGVGSQNRLRDLQLDAGLGGERGGLLGEPLGGGGPLSQLQQQALLNSGIGGRGNSFVEKFQNADVVMQVQMLREQMLLRKRYMEIAWTQYVQRRQQYERGKSIYDVLLQMKLKRSKGMGGAGVGDPSLFGGQEFDAAGLGQMFAADQHMLDAGANGPGQPGPPPSLDQLGTQQRLDMFNMVGGAHPKSPTTPPLGASSIKHGAHGMGDTMMNRSPSSLLPLPPLHSSLSVNLPHSSKVPIPPALMGASLSSMMQNTGLQNTGLPLSSMMQNAGLPLSGTWHDLPAAQRPLMPRSDSVPSMTVQTPRSAGFGQPQVSGVGGAGGRGGGGAGGDDLLGQLMDYRQYLSLSGSAAGAPGSGPGGQHKSELLDEQRKAGVLGGMQLDDKMRSHLAGRAGSLGAGGMGVGAPVSDGNPSASVAPGWKPPRGAGDNVHGSHSLPAPHGEGGGLQHGLANGVHVHDHGHDDVFGSGPRPGSTSLWEDIDGVGGWPHASDLEMLDGNFQQ